MITVNPIKLSDAQLSCLKPGDLHDIFNAEMKSYKVKNLLITLAVSPCCFPVQLGLLAKFRMTKKDRKTLKDLRDARKAFDKFVSDSHVPVGQEREFCTQELEKINALLQQTADKIYNLSPYEEITGYSDMERIGEHIKLKVRRLIFKRANEQRQAEEEVNNEEEVEQALKV